MSGVFCCAAQDGDKLEHTEIEFVVFPNGQYLNALNLLNSQPSAENSVITQDDLLPVVADLSKAAELAAGSIKRIMSDMQAAVLADAVVHIQAMHGSGSLTNRLKQRRKDNHQNFIKDGSSP